MIFANPAMLWALAAVAIPIAVHLFNFRRHRKVYFSNVDRLEELRTESRRQSTLRRWLVLLMRCLAVVALVLAFARPSLPGSAHQLRSGATVVSVYVDNTFSMENSAAAGSQLDLARQKGREIAAAYGPSDRFQLMTADLSGEQFQWLGRDEFLEALDALQITPASRTLGEVVSRQRDFLHQSHAPNQHAYIVSDFQASAADFDQLAPDSLTLTTLVPLEAIASDNLYIDALRLDAPAYFGGGTVSVEVTIRNSGTADAEKIPLRLIVAGRERAVATLDIPAGTAARAALRFTLDSAGWLDARAEITDYPITFDDTYHFSLLAGQPVGMLEVDAAAPNPHIKKLFDGDAAVRYATGSLPPDLEPYHFIVLNEPRSLPSGQAQQLAAWVEQGGTLAVVPAANADAADLNHLLALVRAPRLDVWQPRQMKASSVDHAASLYRNVFSATSSEMEMPSVQGCYRLAAQQAVSHAIIACPDGSPLLSAIPCGAGRLYLFAMPLTAEWTDLVQQALFVPTLYNMALYSLPQPPPAYTLGAADPISLRGSYSPSDTPPQLTSADGTLTLIPDLRRSGGRSVLVPHGDITLAGHYRLADEHLAFNYSRLESDLSFLSASEVADRIDGRNGYTLVRNAARPLDQVLRSRSSGTPLWHWCILAALAALAIEILLIKVPWRSSK